MARKITLLVLPILTAMFLTSSATWTSHAGDKNAGNGRAVKRPQLPAEALRSLALSPVEDGGNVILSAGQPDALDARSPLSAALMTTLGGRGTQFSEVSLLADWDGREDYTADRAQKLDDFSFVEAEIDQTLTRTAVSEHTVANGFNNNVYYYGDSIGNLWVGTDINPGQGTGAQIDTLRQINLPALVNTGASGGVTLMAPGGAPIGATTDCLSDQVTVTGIAVNPVADLGDYGAGQCGVIGEVVYVSVLDTAGCSRNAANQPLRTRIFAFAFTDIAGGLDPVGAIQILRSQFSNTGIAVDDQGSLYYALVDNVQFTGGTIFKSTEQNRTVAGCPSPRVNRVIPSIPSPPNLGSWVGTTANPINVSGGSRHTNFGGGSSTTLGNVVSIAAGPHDVIYAAVARSLNTADDPGTQATEGLFVNPTALGPTPSMIISFSDRSGATDACTSPAPGISGNLPIADGIADVAQNGQTRTAGVNNFRIFALGTGPDVSAAAAAVLAMPASTLKVDMQIDFAIQSGLTVDENGTVYVISGAAPAGVGRNPSPLTGEILAFQDSAPADRRADFIDFRGDGRPNPPSSGGNVGDGDSDRFDHIYSQAPVDPITNTPTGITGLSHGFLRYTNRLAPNPIGPGVTLGVTQPVLGDDDTTNAAVFFEFLDPGHQVAGGDDQNTPFRGDDSNGSGTPAIPAVPNSSAAGTQLNGGFEFSFGGPAADCTWNAFFLNSNGNISFGAGDTDNTPTLVEFRAGPPKIAPAWADLNPNARAVNLADFPVQAIGFTGVNAFKVRWINTTEFGSEGCTTNASNTFGVTLSDDGVAIDENSNQPLNPANPIGNNTVPFDLQEGPTDLRFVKVADPNLPGIFLIGENPRGSGTGNFVNDYGRMDLLGTDSQPVIVGYSVGGLSPLNPPGLCETNLGSVAAASEGTTLGVNGGVGIVASNLIGEGTEPTIYELFDSGSPTMIDPGGGVTFAVPDFDLRDPGNDPKLTTPLTQRDLNQGTVGFYGVSCAPPPNPILLAVIPGPFVPTLTTAGLINSYAPVVLNLIGTGFFPNEVTTVCEGTAQARAGKTVSSAAALSVDTNGDGIPEGTVALTNVTPINSHLVRATIAPLAGAPGTGFPFPESGGLGTVTLTTTFTAGDNNIFGPFTRTGTGSINTGTRAPVVDSVTSSSGDCGVPQDVIITGSSFLFTQFVPGGPSINGTVTRVFAVEVGNPANEINAVSFVVIDTNFIEARFNFGAANAGKQFLIFVTGTGGTSRNAVTVPAGAPAGSPTGNERGNLITFSCAQAAVVPPDTLQFSSANLNVTEESTTVNVTVSRVNAGAGTVSVDYATGDLSATQKGDYEFAAGTLTFGPGEVSKTIPILINEDSFLEGTENFVINLSNPGGGGTAGAPSTVTILDDEVAVLSTNVIDNASDFVRQQYHDFLNRDADAEGLTHWTNEITSCGADAACIDIKRQNGSAAFFLSIEFQETGGNVLRLQRLAFGRKSNEAPTRVPYTQFMRDAQQVGRGVIVGQAGFPAVLEQNKQTYAEQVVTSAAFIVRYPLALSAAAYVDALFAAAGVVPTTAERNAAIAAFAAGGTAGRVAALRSAADASSVRQAEVNADFVLMQYYGYLRRNPTDAPDSNDDGYQFWFAKLNSFSGNFIQAEMVKAFLVSAEYRHRFGP